jgi:CSLREA domain-containing protein
MAKRQRRRRHDRRRQHADQQEGKGGLKLRHSVITGLGVAAGATIGLAAPASAAPLYLTVNSTADNGNGDCEDVSAGDCTLRDALDDTNANAGYDSIYFQSGLTGNIALTNGQIPITDTVSIVGPGATQLSVTAQANNRIFNIGTAGGRVFIEDLTLAGNGTVTGDGGLINNANNELDVFFTVLSGATATGRGGAIFDDGAYANGVYNQLAYSTVSGNHAGTYGGGVYAIQSFGYVYGNMNEDTFYGNTAGTGGGGAINSGFQDIFNSTISGNSGANAGGAYIYQQIYNSNNIFANNTGGAQPDVDPGSGSTFAFDLIENAGGLTLPTSVITGQDPQLGSLANNGGTTPTLKPGPGSPVVDQGYSGAYYDQRQATRIIDNPNKANAAGGNAADIGSLELSVADGPQAPVVTPTPTPAPAPHKKKKCKKKKKRAAAQVAKKKKCKKKKRSARSAHAGSPWRAAPDSLSGQRVRLGPLGARSNGSRHQAFTLRAR